MHRWCWAEVLDVNTEQHPADGADGSQHGSSHGRGLSPKCLSTTLKFFLQSPWHLLSWHD